MSLLTASLRPQTTCGNSEMRTLPPPHETLVESHLLSTLLFRAGIIHNRKDPLTRDKYVYVSSHPPTLYPDQRPNNRSRWKVTRLTPASWLSSLPHARDGGSLMREIRQPGEQSYTYGPYAEPVATCEQEETVAVLTADAFGNLLASEDQTPSSVPGPYLNSQTGPVYIESAEPGDTLVSQDRDYRGDARLGGVLSHPLLRRVYLHKVYGVPSGATARANVDI